MRRHRAALWDDINSVIARLHNVDYAAIGLGDYGKPGNYFERQIGRWSKQYRASETEKIDSMDRLIEWLPRNIIADDASSIVHGDFRLDNLIVHPGRAAGHRRARLGAFHARPSARRLLVSRDGVAADAGAVSRHGRQGSRRAAHSHASAEYVERYCARTGRERIDPDDWEFCVVFSMFRLAAIMQGIAKRVLTGTSADAGAADVGRRARAIADIAWRQVESMEASR